MTLIFNYSSEGTKISGDKEVLHKATLGNGNLDAQLLDINGLRVNAHTLETLYLRAASTGPIYDDNGDLAGFPKAKQYVALKAKFEAQQAAARAFFNEQNGKQINA